MLNFLLLMVLPILIATICIFVFKGKVTLPEFGAQIAVPAVLMVIGLAVAYYQSTTDIEVWNGRITAKTRDRVSCRHSYSCNCRTVCSGSGKSESCSTVCDTCYEHSYDVDWNVHASTGESVRIDGVSRQGLVMPPRWGAAFIGEPFSSSHYYTNYILANPDSVLLGGKGDVEKFKALLPSYPSHIYDYYRANHVLNAGGVPVADMQSWNWLMNEVNGDFGVQKQVNVTLLFVKTADPKYTLALKDAWLGGKKNDAIIVIASLDGHKIEFADVVSWSPAALFKIALKDDIQRIGSLDRRDEIATVIRAEVGGKFQRMHMKDYQYLVRSFQPSSTAMVWLIVIGIVASIGLAIWCVGNDMTDDSDYGENFWTWGQRSRYNRYRSPSSNRWPSILR